MDASAAKPKAKMEESVKADKLKATEDDEDDEDEDEEDEEDDDSEEVSDEDEVCRKFYIHISDQYTLTFVPFMFLVALLYTREHYPVCSLAL